jgi:voltage-gated potassium channel
MTSESKAQVRAPLSFRESLRRLYHGHTPRAMRFQAAVMTLDLAIIGFFIAAPVLDDWSWFLWIDYIVATLLGMDLAGRALAARNIVRWLRQPTVWVDFFIFVTLLLPAELVNLAFLRILRLWSVSRSGFIWRPLDRRGLRRWRDPAHAVVNLITFLFVITGFVYTFFFRSRAGLDGYVDALYFTVTTITTTGFGDITLPGIGGKLTSILVMIIGISLFVKVGQSIFRPHKIFFTCPKCALQRHDPDAVFCKACGHPLQIPDEGGWSS